MTTGQAWNEPLIYDIGEVDLLCRTVLDCADTFQRHMPIVDAAERLVAPRGACVVKWEKPWADLIAAVQAKRAAKEAA